MEHIEPPWWQRGIIYQIYPRSFQDSNGDGIGDLAGITQRLDYLHNTLDITGIWLSPFYPSPMADFGYDVSDYRDVDPIFGTLADFDELVSQVHRRDMKIIVDFVPNHSSDQHPWFQESRSSRYNPRRDWYYWRDAAPDGGPPNNWLGNFGGSAWEWDETTRQYYLHSFLREQPDLNWRNLAVKEEMLDTIRFWLERGVDGIRIDVARAIMKDPELRDNPPNPAAASDARPFDQQLHLHDSGHPDIHGAFREIRQVLDAYSNQYPRMAVGEIYEHDWPTWASYYGGQLDELHMPFNFALLSIPWTAQAVREVVDATEAAVPPQAWPNYVLGNHDRPRVASRIGVEQARVGLMLLLTLRGAPTIYYGDEIGMTDVPIALDRVYDPWELNEPNRGLGRDPERTPMQWDGAPHAGFCLPEVQPWLPVSDDVATINVATEVNDPRSMLSLARALTAARRMHPALTDGAYTPLDGTPSPCFAYTRRLGDAAYLIALNFSAEKQIVDAATLGHGNVLLSTHLDKDGKVDLGRLTLRPNEGVIIALQR